MMKSAVLRISLFGVLFAVIAFAGAQSGLTDVKQITPDQPRSTEHRLGRQQQPLSYRSPGARHKLKVSSRDIQLENQLLASGAATRVKRYGEYSLVEVTSDQLSSLGAAELQRLEVRDDLNLILLRRGQIDTTGPAPTVSAELRQPSGVSHSLHMVQLFGPPTTSAIGAIKQTGAKIVTYIPNNAYLVWATPGQVSKLRSLRRESDVVQWDGPYHPAYKLDPRIKLDSVEQIKLSINLVDSETTSQAIGAIKALARRVIVPEFTAAGSVHLKIVAESFRLPELVRLPEVVSIEPWAEFRLQDERASQIAAGSLTFDTANSVQVARPSAPGYLSLLSTLGISSDFNFAIDIGDTGFDVGSADPARVHKDFLNAAGASRVAYINDYTGDPHPDPAHDPQGHGTLNASVAVGFNNQTGSAFRDALGFQYGLGAAPFARLGISKLFADNGNFTGVSFDTIESNAYQGGARIQNNSWGACDSGGFCNLYTDDCVVFDSMTRDADVFTVGNQGMILVFAAGNDGDSLPQSISSPGTAKNVITVGASESFRTDGSVGSPGTELEFAL